MAAERPSEQQLARAAQDVASELVRAFGGSVPVTMRGKVVKAVGMLVEATGIQAHIGELCELAAPGEVPLLAEVVGFRGNVALLTPLGSLVGVSAMTEVMPVGRGHVTPVGSGLLGRVIDAMGQPVDGLGPLIAKTQAAVHREPVNAMRRQMIAKPLASGVRVIDSLLTFGEGQRVGIFSPPGVGKSTLLGMLARGSSADVNVVALIGERGREVREFIEHGLGGEGLAKTVLVVSTSDRPPMERIKSAYVATTIAEHFRDEGKRVLLLMDSLSRFARAQREIGLASGEPPTRRGYPPSLFSMLPQLLERAGQGERGAMTAVYTVLTEGEDESDPVAEEARSILDGHLVLSRKLAAAGRYPAIDVLASISRVMPLVTSAGHQRDAARVRALIAKHEELELLLQIGEYKQGSDALADAAVSSLPRIRELLQQPPAQRSGFEDGLRQLARLAQASFEVEGQAPGREGDRA